VSSGGRGKEIVGSSGLHLRRQWVGEGYPNRVSYRTSLRNSSSSGLSSGCRRAWVWCGWVIPLLAVAGYCVGVENTPPSVRYPGQLARASPCQRVKPPLWSKSNPNVGCHAIF